MSRILNIIQETIYTLLAFIICLITIYGVILQLSAIGTVDLTFNIVPHRFLRAIFGFALYVAGFCALLMPEGKFKQSTRRAGGSILSIIALACFALIIFGIKCMCTNGSVIIIFATVISCGLCIAFTKLSLACFSEKYLASL